MIKPTSKTWSQNTLKKIKMRYIDALVAMSNFNNVTIYVKMCVIIAAMLFQTDMFIIGIMKPFFCKLED